MPWRCVDRTRAELEATYHTIHETDPELLEKLTYGQARKIVAGGAKRGGDRKSEEARSNDKLSIDSQPDRARTNSVGIVTQRKLDKLHDQRPELFARVEPAEVSSRWWGLAGGLEPAKTEASVTGALSRSSARPRWYAPLGRCLRLMILTIGPAASSIDEDVLLATVDRLQTSSLEECGPLLVARQVPKGP
jgi:hypothetical protein